MRERRQLGGSRREGGRGGQRNERGDQGGMRGGAHGRAGWMGAGTVFKRKEKERGESSEWLVHY